MCSNPAPFRAHERQISEIRLVAIIIAQDLNLLLRSTARIGSTCVPKQPYDNPGKRAHECSQITDGLGRKRFARRAFYAYSPIAIFVRRTVSSAIGRTLARPSASTESTYEGSAITCAIAFLDRLQAGDQYFCHALLEVAVAHARGCLFGKRRITGLRDA